MGGTEISEESFMAVASTMQPLGTEAPDFELTDTVSGQTIGLADYRSKRAILVMFICNHCPYVKHVQPELMKLGVDYADSDLGVVAISSNDPATYPEDSPQELGREARRLGYRFPVLFDENQEVAKAYSAACTPDFFLFDAERRLVYRGQLDDSRPGNGQPVTGRDLRAAIHAVLSGQPLTGDQRPSVGCSIKWRPGNEPN
jgi:peroxiredoxin